ncbi:hypothetical protein ACFQZJ_15550 [Maribacter chungangensis]|uniref:Uncharacterized protein n=1 Tax=Maribacter chungangensis TaxID=1069117 RepID=A0ABW3B7S4_9FLAO
MAKSLCIFSLFLMLSCSNFGQLKYITGFPFALDEVSGILHTQDSTIWALEDGGNKDEIYKVDYKGKILKTLEIKNAKNKDWEDMTKDFDGNVYIADTGNNDNERKDLVIYKIPNPDKEKDDKIKAEKIEFHYPEQKKFPPKKASQFFDAEAIFHTGNRLYLVTKNRAKPFNGQAFIYSLPDRPGKYTADLVGTITVCPDSKTCQITAITISPNKKKIVALGYGKLFVFTDFEINDFSKGTMATIDLGTRTQLESVCFMNDTTLLLADEVSHGSGGNLYRYKLSDQQ